VIADESITIQKLVHLSLAAEQFEVIASSDGQDAYLKVKSMKPDLLLVDAGLRQISGVELIEKVRSDSSLSRIKTCLLVGTSLKTDVKKGGPIDEVLKKPFDAKALMDLVHRLLLDEDSTVVRLNESDDDEKTPVVPKKILQVDQKREAINKKLEQLVSEVKEAPREDLSSLDEDTAKMSPASFKHPVNTKIEPAPVEAPKEVPDLARQEIRSWIEANLPRLAEEILKEEILKITQNR
jgi:DNA-binding response OmpR family regulator